MPNVRLQGLEHAMQFTAIEKEGKPLVYIRSYRIILKKSGSKLPRVELDEMGPSMDLVVRRTHLSSDDLFGTACKQVKNVDKPKKVKNITKDDFGSTLGRVHIPAQKIGTIQIKKMKGLKPTPEEKKLKKIKEKKEKAEAVRKSKIANVFAE